VIRVRTKPRPRLEVVEDEAPQSLRDRVFKAQGITND
jgi:hypothetical protein